MSNALAERTTSQQSLLHCWVCNIELPLRLPAPGEAGERFACARCGSSFVAALVPDAPPHLLSNARQEQAASKSLWLPGERARRPVVAVSQGTVTQVPKSRSAVLRPQPSAITRQLDEIIDDGVVLRQRSRSQPFIDTIAPRGAEDYDPAWCRELTKTIDASAGEMDELFRDLRQSSKVDIERFSTLAQQTLQGATSDLDLFVALGINMPEGEYPYRHSLHVGMLAMAIGTTLGLDEQTLVELGMGCLVHDVGMLNVQDQLHQQSRELPLNEFTAIVRHPIHTFTLLERNLDAVPVNARMVAYQMHERCNGSGYPRGRHASSIHRLAKIAAVADVYVALVSPRPHRPGVVPYHAVRHLLQGASEGLYDPDSVRALLQTMSLFPVGSFVELSDGRVGRVVRGNGVTFDRPVVEVVMQARQAVKPHLIDLATAPELKVVRALASPR